MKITTNQKYIFKDLESDFLGYEILNDEGIVVGGIHTRIIPHFIEMLFIDAIEILPEYRNKGYATQIINKLKEENRLVSGNVWVFGAMKYWQKHKAVFYFMFRCADEIGKQYLTFVLDEDKQDVKDFLTAVKRQGIKVAE